MQFSAPIALIVVTMGPAAGPAANGAPELRRPSTQPIPKGPWIPKRIVEAGLKRMARDIARRHNMDAKQAAVLEKQVLSRFPAFLKKHRPTLQPLLNEYFELAIIAKAPTARQMARWVKAFQPVMRAGVNELEGMHREVRKVLGPEQIKTWDRDYRGLVLGKVAVEAELARLAQGKFDPRHWHQPFPKPPRDARMPVRPTSPGAVGPQPGQPAGGVGRSAARGNRFIARRGGTVGPPRYGEKPPVTVERVSGGSVRTRPLTAWESYVKQFIKRHGLDKGQTNSAMAILEELQNQAKAYEAKHREEMARLSRAIAAADPAARPTFQAELDEVRRPIDEAFTELRERLDGLLTEAQRGGKKP